MEDHAIFLKFLFILCLVITNNFRLSFCEEKAPNKNARIIIIGSGPSGIAAATKLMENGFTNITILEAENRIGGRVYTTKLGNYSVDIGGQWVHGEVGNVAFEMANPLGLLDVSTDHNFGLEDEFLDSSGNHVDPEISRKLQQFFDTHTYYVDFEKHPGYESVGQYADKTFDEVFENDTAVMSGRKKYLDYLELIRIASESSESWHDISGLGTSVYKECPGDQMTNWKERGYSTILDILMKRYPNPENELPVTNNTILNTEVTSIDYSNHADGAPVLITTANGHIYKADHVIVTVSLGVLKERHKSLFIPALPDYKVNAIETIGFGVVAKIWMLFDEPFWNLGDKRRVLHFSFIWNDDERKEIEADPEKKWLLGMAGTYTTEHKPNLLALWLTGKYVKHMEALPEEKVFSHSVENLKRFLGKAYNVSTPVAMLRSRWYTNPHFRGTYSYQTPESYKQKAFPELLERPLDLQTLSVLFAGEATEPDRFSTVDGAIKSGWKAADRLIEHYKSSSGPPPPGA